MYIPLIPHRREHAASIWGPSATERTSISPSWQSSTTTSANREEQATLELKDYDPSIAPVSVTSTPPRNAHTLNGSQHDSAAHQTSLENSDDAFSVAQLFRSLNLTTPSPLSVPSTELSVMASSTDSSPVHSIPTPPDCSPLQLNNLLFVSNSSPSPFESLERISSGVVAPHRYEHVSAISFRQQLGGGTDLDMRKSRLHSVADLSSASPDHLILKGDQSGLKFDDPRGITFPASVDPNLSGFQWSHLDSPSSVRPVADNRYAASPHRLTDVMNDHQANPCIRAAVEDQGSISAPPWLKSKETQTNEPINFLHLLSPSSSPPYSIFVQRIITYSDQQASIFLQQKLKASADIPEERQRIVDAICSCGFEMMCNRFGNWAVQRCIESNLTVDELCKIVHCVKGRVIELATNCYGTHCLQKLLDCEEDIRLLIVSELLMVDPCATLLNKHASHVWGKIMELTWTPPAPPIFDYIHRALDGKWSTLACHETGSLVVQHAFENLEPNSKEGIVQELLKNDDVFREIVKNQWGSFCISHLLELGSPNDQRRVIERLLSNLLEYATHEHGIKSVLKAVKEGNPGVKASFVEALCQSPKGGRRVAVVDVALSATGSQLLTNLMPSLGKEHRNQLYTAIRPFIVTLRGSKTGSKTIWLFERMVKSILRSMSLHREIDNVCVAFFELNHVLVPASDNAK